MNIDDITKGSEPKPWHGLDSLRDGMGAMSQPVTMAGELSKNFVDELTGQEGEKRGVVPARDEGVAKEFVKGVNRGAVQLQSSVGKTLGQTGFSAAKDYFLRTNQQLFDSERKGALSYIANTGGAAIGQNLPNFAAMLALGGAGAPAWAIRGVMMGGTYLQSYGENKEDLDRHVGDTMSPMAKTGTAVAQSIVDSILEIGLGAEARAIKSVSKLAMAKKLAQAGGITEMEKLGTRTMGVLGKAIRGEMVKSGVGEMSDTLLQNIHKDVVNLSLDDKATGQDVLKRLAEYPRELQEAFIGGAFMGIVPMTINAIANARTTAEINRLTEDNKKKQELVDTAVVEQDGQTRTFVDEEAKARTAQAFADFSEVVKNKNVGTLMYKMAYNMAYAERQADPKSAVRPESYIGELKVLFADKGVDMKRVEELSGNTGELLKYLASKDQKFGERLSNMADSLEAFDLNRQLDPVRRDVATKSPVLTEAEKESVGLAIDKMMGGVRTDIIPAGDIKKLVPKEVLRRMYAGRVLQGVQIGKAKFDLLVQDGMSVRVFEQGMLTVQQIGGDKLSQKLATLRKESVDIAQSLQRLQNFDGVYAGKAPVALLTPGVRFVAGERGVEDVRSQLNPYFSANAKLENIWNDAQAGNAQAVDALKYLNIKAKADITAIEEDRAKRAKVPTLREIAEERWAQEAETERVKVWGEEKPHDALMRLAGEATRYQAPEEGATSRLLRLGQESQTGGGPLFSKRSSLPQLLVYADAHWKRAQTLRRNAERYLANGREDIAAKDIAQAEGEEKKSRDMAARWKQENPGIADPRVANAEADMERDLEQKRAARSAVRTRESIVAKYNALIPDKLPNGKPHPKIRLTNRSLDNAQQMPDFHVDARHDKRTGAIEVTPFTDDMDKFELTVAHEVAHEMVPQIHNQVLGVVMRTHNEDGTKTISIQDDKNPALVSAARMAQSLWENPIGDYLPDVKADMVKNGADPKDGWVDLEWAQEAVAESWALKYVGGRLLSEAVAKNPEALKLADAAFEGTGFSRFSKTGKGQIVGQYQRDQKLAIFYADHDASTIVHEWFHHLTENKLMPSKFQQALTDSFAVQTGDERRWNAASAENAAAAFLQYVRDGQIPEGHGATDAFKYIKGVLKSHWQELNQVVTVDGDLMDTGAELDFSKYENLKKEFDGLFADAAPDAEQTVYGGALTASMLAGDVSDPVYVSDGSLRAAAARAVAKQGDGLDAEAFVKQQLVARPDLFGGRDRLENLSPEERALAQLFFEQMATSEETGPVVDEQPQVLFARKPAEERRQTLWNMAHRGFVDHDAASEYARSKFKVRSMADLTDEQLQEMVGRDGNPTVDPDVDAGAIAVAGAISETTGGLRVGPEVWGNPLQRFVNNVLIRGAKNIGESLIASGLMDWDGMWKYVAENVSNPVIDDFRKKFTSLRNAVSRTRTSFITDFLKDADKQGLDQTFRMSLNGHKVNIGGLALTPSQALDIWLKADFGKNLQRSDIVRMREASPEYTESVVKAAIKYVQSTDPRLAKLGVLMQKYNERVFTPASAVYKTVTGRELPPITGAYTPMLYANGNPQEFDDNYLKFLESLDQRQPPTQPGAPSGLHSRSGTAGSGILLDAWGNFARHADTLMNYAAKAEGVKEAVQLLSDKRVIDAFVNKYGTTKYRDALLRMARRELTPGAMLKNANNEYGGAMARKLMTNAYHAFLPYNPFTVLTQTISVANGMATIPAAESVEMTKNFLSLAAKLRVGMVNGAKVEDSEEFKFVRKHSPYIAEAFKVPSQEGYIESVNNRGIDALKIGSWTFGQFKDKGLHFMYNMDVIVRLSVYKTAFESKAKELRTKGVAEPAVEARAAQYAEDCIRLSQNPSSSHERSLWQSEAPEMAKLFFPFTSQPFSNLRYQTLNILLPTIRAWDKAGAKGVLSQIVANPSIYYKMGMSTVVPALMLGMIARRRPQKDLEELLNDLKFSLIINIPIIGHAAWASAALGWDSAGGGGLMGDLLGGLTDVTSDVISGDFDFKTTANARRSLELLTGIPDWPVKVATRLYDKVAVVGGKWDGQSVLKITGMEAR